VAPQPERRKLRELLVRFVSMVSPDRVVAAHGIGKGANSAGSSSSGDVLKRCDRSEQEVGR